MIFQLDHRSWGNSVQFVEELSEELLCVLLCEATNS